MPKPVKPKSTITLRPEVAALFVPREDLLQVFACAEFGRVDLAEVNLQLAEQMAEKGYLKKLHQADAV